MAQLIELKAEARPRGGKGAARQARRDGKIPAVIYGDARQPETINLDYNTLWKQVLKGHFTSTVFNVEIDGKKQLVIPRDLQVDPVKDLPLHVDFLRVGKELNERWGVRHSYLHWFQTALDRFQHGCILAKKRIVHHKNPFDFI